MFGARSEKKSGQVPWEISSLIGDFFFMPAKEVKDESSYLTSTAKESLAEENRKLDEKRREIEEEKAQIEEQRKQLLAIVKRRPSSPETIRDTKTGLTEGQVKSLAVNRIVIQAGELTWLSITEDENPAYQIMMRPGERIEREAGKFQLDIGNAGGIEITFNGTDLGSQGRNGQVVHLVLPRE